MSNRLAEEISPYLLQHADDPVDWYPWGEAAFAEARRTGRPVMLSAGYSSCHWCHVMARESFRDPAVAQILNESFVSVKLDREERPDVDDYYMTAVQALTGAGGWPMTVFLTPDGKPFHGGTYYPPDDRHGLPGFSRLLRAVEAAWTERRQAVLESADQIADRLGQLGGGVIREQDLGLPGPTSNEFAAVVREAFDSAIDALAAQEDRQHGGFGDPRGGPKFPPHSALVALLSARDARALDMARRVLDAMATGGVYDHLAGGFFRYSVDPAWRVPHFEKMLYDNAQLIAAYAEAFALTGEQRYREVVLETIGWLEAEMMIEPQKGRIGFFSAIDADSEGEEGRFYAWSLEDFRAALGDLGEPAISILARRYGVDAAGDFEGGNVLRIAASLEELAADGRDIEKTLRQGKELLNAARSRRVRPETDDKVLTSWNGLLLSALATAGSRLEEPELHARALELARFLVERRDDGELQHVWRGGGSRITGLLEDYAFLGNGLLDLYLATQEAWLLVEALRLADEIDEHFRDAEGGGWFDSALRTDGAPARLKSHTDGATPSRYVAAARLVWWAGRYRSDHRAQERASEAVTPLMPAAAGAPQAFGSALRLLKEMASPEREIVVVGDRGRPEVRDAVTAVRGAALPGDVVLLLDTWAAGGDPLADLQLAEGRYPPSPNVSDVAIYVCRAGVCELPVHDAGSAVRAMLTG